MYVFRQRLNSRRQTRSFRTQLYGSPTVVFEDKNSGAQLIQDVRRESMLDVSGAGPTSGQGPASIRLPRLGPCEGRVKLAQI